MDQLDVRETVEDVQFVLPIQLGWIYQAVSEDSRGVLQPLPQLFYAKELAKAASKGWGGARPNPFRRPGLRLEDGRVWLLDNQPLAVFASWEEMERQIALNKLTAKERALLGLAE